MIDNGLGISDFDFLGKVQQPLCRKALLPRIKEMSNLTTWASGEKPSIR